MPKAIKKKAARKKPIEEGEVKGFALEMLEKTRERQKQILIAGLIIIGIIALYVIVSMYSASLEKEAYALERDAHDYYYGTGAGESLSREERMQKAIDLYKKSVDIKASPTALYYLGNAYFNMNDYGSAITQFRTFIDKFSHVDSILPLVYQKLAAAYFRTGDNNAAMDTLKHMRELKGGIFGDTAMMMEARHYERAGQTEKALQTYRELVTEYPASVWSAEASSKITAREESAQPGQTEADSGVPAGDPPGDTAPAEAAE